MIQPTPGSDVQLERFREHVREAVDVHAHATVRKQLVELLCRPGYALHRDGLCRAGLLVLDVYEAVTGTRTTAPLLAGAAVELQMEAAYVFDEVADSDQNERRGEDLALAIALLTAGAAAAAESARSSPDPSTALNHFFTSYGEACAGQFLDGMLQRRGGASLEDARQATCLKAGGLGKFAAGFGARVAGADEEAAALFDRLGHSVFTFAQLIDDLRDACPRGQHQASDLAQRKATLPVIFFSREVDSLEAGSGMLPATTRCRYESSGAPLYAAILAQAYMNRALEDLSLLAQRGYEVGGLFQFLEGLDSGAEGTLSVARRSLVA